MQSQKRNSSREASWRVLPFFSGPVDATDELDEFARIADSDPSSLSNRCMRRNRTVCSSYLEDIESTQKRSQTNPEEFSGSVRPGDLPVRSRSPELRSVRATKPLFRLSGRPPSRFGSHMGQDDRNRGDQNSEVIGVPHHWSEIRNRVDGNDKIPQGAKNRRPGPARRAGRLSGKKENQSLLDHVPPRDPSMSAQLLPKARLGILSLKPVRLVPGHFRPLFRRIDWIGDRDFLARIECHLKILRRTIGTIGTVESVPPWGTMSGLERSSLKNANTPGTVQPRHR